MGRFSKSSKSGRILWVLYLLTLVRRTFGSSTTAKRLNVYLVKLGGSYMLQVNRTEFIMKGKDFIEVSIRGRVAFGVVCLENAIKHFNRLDLEWNFLLKLLWSYTNDNVGTWHYQLAECIPSAVMVGDDKYLDFLSKQQFWEFNKLYSQCNDEILQIIDLIFSIGVEDLYSSIVNNSPETICHLNDIINILNNDNIPLPSIDLFERFPITENHGWGREFTRAEVYDGI